MKKAVQKGIATVLLLLFGAAAVVFFFLNFPSKNSLRSQEWGITFTPGQAMSLDLDWRETYAALLDDLGVRRVRLVAYWNVIEKTQGAYSFEELDEQMNELAARGGKAILAIGRKLPRWPECHEPDWLSGLSKKEREAKLQQYLGEVIQRYKAHLALGNWQVENEITFPFGECPSKDISDLKTLKKEVDFVREQDPKHSIILTDSGEWSSWTRLAPFADIIGSSLYRGAWNDHVGYIAFPIGPGWYQVRADYIRTQKKDVIITELQAEPWGEKAIQEMTPEEGLALLSIGKIRDNIDFAKDVGFSQVYLWGGEWWYWLKKHGNDSVWNELRGLF